MKRLSVRSTTSFFPATLCSVQKSFLRIEFFLFSFSESRGEQSAFTSTASGGLCEDRAGGCHTAVDIFCCERELDGAVVEEGGQALVIVAVLCEHPLHVLTGG